MVKSETRFRFLVIFDIRKNNGLSKEYIDFINEYKDKKYHKSYSLRDFDLYSYASNKGKFGFGNLLLDILVTDFSAVEIKLFLSIVNQLKQSKDFEESAVINASYALYSDICSHPVFYKAKSKFEEYGFLIPTPKKKYYIVNPLYINKFYKLKIDRQ